MRTRLAVAVLVILAGVTTALASGATFAISGQGIALSDAKGLPEDGMQFHAKAELGKPFTLTAQGMVLPRGGKPEPSAPEAGTWTFDDKTLKRLTPDKKDADKTKIAIRLEPTAVGTTRVRFAGKILGYERSFDVIVEVIAPK
jgi:hypothetical protein